MPDPSPGPTTVTHGSNRTSREAIRLILFHPDLTQSYLVRPSRRPRGPRSAPRRDVRGMTPTQEHHRRLRRRPVLAAVLALAPPSRWAPPGCWPVAQRPGSASRTAVTGPAGFRAERLRVQPGHAAEPDPGHGSTRSPASRPATSSAPSATRCCSSRAPTARPRTRCSSRSATTPAWPASGPPRATSSSTAPSTRSTSAPDAGSLHRAEQLLALAVEPDHQRPGAAERRAVPADG